jgi:hypothetical protein
MQTGSTGKMTDEQVELKRCEEEKRDAHWDAAQRWRVIQEAIVWADAQAIVPRNSKTRCLELQRAKMGPAATESASGRPAGDFH